MKLGEREINFPWNYWRCLTGKMRVLATPMTVRPRASSGQVQDTVNAPYCLGDMRIIWQHLGHRFCAKWLFLWVDGEEHHLITEFGVKNSQRHFSQESEVPPLLQAGLIRGPPIHSHTKPSPRTREPRLWDSCLCWVAIKTQSIISKLCLCFGFNLFTLSLLNIDWIQKNVRYMWIMNKSGMNTCVPSTSFL